MEEKEMEEKEKITKEIDDIEQKLYDQMERLAKIRIKILNSKIFVMK